MKVLKYAPAALGAAALALFAAPSAYAQTDVVVFGGAGSSALLNPLARAANSTNLPHHYTLGKGSGNYPYIYDSSAPTIQEKGDLFVTWEDIEGNGTRKIIFYISVDSTVGNRAYFNKDTIKVNNSFPAVGATITSARAPLVISNFNAISPTPTAPAETTTDETMPTDVANAVLAVNNANGSFTGAGSDVLPIDCLVATQTALGLGYNSTNQIHETTSLGSGTATPIAFKLSSRDNGNSFVKQIGAEPVVVFVNTSDSQTGGLGSFDMTTSAPLVTNIDRFVLAGFVNGSFSRSSDLITGKGAPTTTTVSTWIREPISGTYVAFQNCIPASKEIATTQELGVSATANNPLNETPNPQGTGVTGARRRAIGTGDMVKAISNNSDSLGYAFWSTGAFATTKSVNTKYITVDGVDPLLPNYSTNNGAYPLGTSGGTATFDHVKDGSYPIWSILRLVLPTAPTNDGTPINIATFIGNISPDDIVPFNQLRVFRSHRSIFIPGVVSQSGSNGNAAGTTESGSDAGGAVYPINVDLDFYNDTGSELTEQQQ